jgi:hypothetical protein
LTASVRLSTASGPQRREIGAGYTSDIATQPAIDVNSLALLVASR